MSTRRSTPFKRLAHALIDGLAADATWQDLAAEVRLQIELEEAVSEAEKSFVKPKPGTTGANVPAASGVTAPSPQCDERLR